MAYRLLYGQHAARKGCWRARLGPFQGLGPGRGQWFAAHFRYKWPLRLRGSAYGPFSRILQKLPTFVEGFVAQNQAQARASLTFVPKMLDLLRQARKISHKHFLHSALAFPNPAILLMVAGIMPYGLPINFLQ